MKAKELIRYILDQLAEQGSCKLIVEGEEKQVAEFYSSPDGFRLLLTGAPDINFKALDDLPAISLVPTDPNQLDAFQETKQRVRHG